MRHTRHCFVLGGVFAAAIGLWSARIDAQSSPVVGVPDLYAEAKELWVQKLPGGRVIGALSSLAPDPDGHSIWAFERCGGIGRGNDYCLGRTVDPVLKFDASGKVVASFGGGMFNYPHGIHMDRDGNLWFVDGQTKTG